MSQIQASASTSFTVTQVQQQIQDAIAPITGFDKVALADGLNRILASDVCAGIDVPAFDNSAMDGYAFAAHDLNFYPELTVVGHSYAGHPYPEQLLPGQAIQITTGAVMPASADSVLPQELASLKDSNTLVMTGIAVTPGQHRRRRGEDLGNGNIALTRGTRLGPAELGLLSSLGITEIDVQRPLRVAIFSTGDELQLPGQPLASGAIYDSNRVTLRAMLMRFGAQVTDLGIVKDDPAVIEAALRSIAPEVDAIITSGGVAAGAADFTRQIIQQLGQLQSWHVNMRPGRPLAFGKLNKVALAANTCIFGLPGNPVAMMVSFYLFVRPALQLLSGSPVSMTLPVKAISARPIAKKAGRTEFQRGTCRLSPKGNLRVYVNSQQGSGMLSSMTEANCLVMLSAEQENIAAGDTVKVLLFDGLI